MPCNFCFQGSVTRGLDVSYGTEVWFALASFFGHFVHKKIAKNSVVLPFISSFFKSFGKTEAYDLSIVAIAQKKQTSLAILSVIGWSTIFYTIKDT